MRYLIASGLLAAGLASAIPTLAGAQTVIIEPQPYERVCVDSYGYRIACAPYFDRYERRYGENNGQIVQTRPREDGGWPTRVEKSSNGP